jgi:hypothetical protein
MGLASMDFLKDSWFYLAIPAGAMSAIALLIENNSHLY